MWARLLGSKNLAEIVSWNMGNGNGKISNKIHAKKKRKSEKVLQRPSQSLVYNPIQSCGETLKESCINMLQVIKFQWSSAVLWRTQTQKSFIKILLTNKVMQKMIQVIAAKGESNTSTNVFGEAKGGKKSIIWI